MGLPSGTPTSVLTNMPSVFPSTSPSDTPSRFPSSMPSTLPSTSPATPSSFPSSTPSNIPLSSPNDCVPQKNFCKHNEDKLLIEYKTDWSSQNQTTIYIDKQNKKGGFKNLMRFEDFPRNVLLTYGICLRKKRCHRFRIYR